VAALEAIGKEIRVDKGRLQDGGIAE
jgi:hypothetical protein